MNMEKRRKWLARWAAFLGVCAGLALAVPGTGFAAAREEMEEILESSLTVAATDSNAVPLSLRSAGTGELWAEWTGDMSFLSGRTGDGTEKKPYQISTKAQLMGLSELAAMGMEIDQSEGTYPGDYSGAHFRLTRDIDLGGMDWIPIGFYRNAAQVNLGNVSAFDGHFDGNGKTISNFRLYRPAWSTVGLFGAVKNAEIVNLTVKPGYVITAGEDVGILAGSAENSVIRCVTVAGTLKTAGNAGGIVGETLGGTVVENCTADHVAMDSGEGKETFTGGIAGKAAESVISDCVVNTGDSLSARIQGGGYVGGITGFQNDTDIFNVHVMGTIGGSGAQSIGGVTGKYASGKMKVARFEGKIASSGLGSAAREGTFIGTHDTGFHFRYGTEAGADLAYLFADTEGKILSGVCGSGIPDDNVFSYDAHIGFWHSGDNFFTLIQGQSTKTEGEKYFYEELEEGMLHIIDTEESVKDMMFLPDHFAPSAVGRPIRGYLVSVLQIDTAANVENYYDVATLTARGGSAYSQELNKSCRGAVAPGDTVTVITAPRNTAGEKYQMDGVPTYTDASGKRIDTAYQAGGSYSFVMPEHDTEVSAVYRKVAANIRVVPEEFAFRVTEERTGDRKNPSIVTEVRNAAGKLIARYINGQLEEGTKVQEVRIEAVVDKNNDVADSRVRWSVDDGNLICLKTNDDEDAEGYTEKSANLQLNLKADFFQNIIRKAEKEQADKQYQYPISDTVYGNGTLGGVAVLTAETRPAASFEEKTLTANCRIPVTFQIRDKTRVAAESVNLDKKALSFTITRTLFGDRKNPEETLSVTGPFTLRASFEPDYFDKKDISWSVDDKNVIQADAGGYSSEDAEKDYKNASVWAVKDTKWIRDIMAADDAAHEENPYGKRSGKGERTAIVTVTADDSLGNKETASCEATVVFRTVDKTEIRAEEVTVDKTELKFDMTLTRSGNASKPELTWTGTEGQKVTAEVIPAAPDGNESNDQWPGLSWELDRGMISIDEGGTVTPVTGAEWITAAMKKYPYTAERETSIRVFSGDKEKVIPVRLAFKLADRTWSSSGSGGSGRSSANGGSLPGSGLARMTAPKGSVTGIWTQDKVGNWFFESDGRTYAGEWAYICNPYAEDGQGNTAWFRFDENGVMKTGWYQDPSDEGWYYLHTVPDGNLGRMDTGWHKIGESWYYFSPNGRMVTGWNWIDGRCYYMDLESGRMLSDTVTPDGYMVDESGAWTVKGTVQVLGEK